MTSGRTVLMNSQKVTLMSDYVLLDHTSLDRYVQGIERPAWTIADWRREISNGTVRIRNKIVWIMLGSVDMQQKTEGKIANKLRKLIIDVFNYSGQDIQIVYVSTILPVANKEVEFQDVVRANNIQIAKMARELRMFTHRPVRVLALHKLVLEKFRYFDLNTGLMSLQFRIIKPVDRLFEVGQSRLNPIGRYDIKAYALQHMGIARKNQSVASDSDTA